VRVACLAQLVNVIAPLMTNSTQVLRQTIYYPYAWALKYARGKVLDLAVESETYTLPRRQAGPPFQTQQAAEPVPYLDAVGTVDPQGRECCLLVLNRDLQAARELEVAWHDAVPSRVLTYETLTGSDLKAVNTFEQPKRVVPEPLEPPKPGSKMILKLPPKSYTVLRVSIS